MLPDRSRPRSLLLAVALLAAVALATHRPARAADVKTDTSLALIPADAAFYSAGLRWKEQVDLFYKSKAYKALRSLPTVKKAYAEAMTKLGEADGPAEMALKFLKTDLGKDVTTVLTEAVSDEVFYFGGKSWVSLIEVTQAMNSAQQFAPLQAALTGGNPNRAQGRAVLQSLMKNRAKVKVPDLVIGFRLATPKKAAALLDKVEKVLSGLVVGQKEWEDRLKPKVIAGGKFITLEMDGSQLPLKDADLSDIEEKKGEFDDLIKHVEKSKLTVAVGVSGNYLLVSVGEQTRELEALLGKGKKLHEVPAFKPVLDAGDRKFTSLGYTSKEPYEAVVKGQASPATMARELREMLKAADLKEERKKAIARDLDEIVKQLSKDTGVVYGANVAYSYLTGTGYEAYHHDFTKYPHLDKIKFNIHRHFGGDPIFAAAFGAYADGSGYRETVTLAKKVWGHAEAVFLDMADAATADEYKKQMKVFAPILQKMDDTTTKLLIPSIEQTGLGLVIDGKWKSKQWVPALPALGKEMPMAELGLLVGVSDGKKFIAAMREYRKHLIELWGKLRDVPNLAALPDLNFPEAKEEKTADGSLYWWDLPEGVLDRQFVPTVGTGKAAAVFTLSKKHAARLIKTTELKFREKELAFKGDVIGCCVLDWVGFIELATPWVEYSVEQAAKDLAGEGKDEKTVKAQARKWAREATAALKIMKAFRGSTSTTRVTGGAVVYRTVIVVRDIEAMPDPLD